MSWETSRRAAYRSQMAIRVRAATRASSAHASKPQRGSKRSLEESEDGWSQGHCDPAEGYDDGCMEEWEDGEDPFEMRGRNPRGFETGEVDEGAGLMGPQAFSPAGPRESHPTDESEAGTSSSRPGS